MVLAAKLFSRASLIRRSLHHQKRKKLNDKNYENAKQQSLPELPF
jgi:hypothetical protein